ncbi:hypothetical protein IKE13_02520 [Candidatus Saccharibacteria bacterium]|nr:hypothetical protein [Candidatus Saccharibacteria bacterium]MBR2803016.1 hypothetical protein [Candidatus Saccharibacteria bacterium]
MNRNRRAIKRVFVSLLTIIIIALIIAFIVNRAWIYDFFRGLNYHPTTEMASIRSALNLTDYGPLVFNSSWPEETNYYKNTNRSMIYTTNSIS